MQYLTLPVTSYVVPNIGPVAGGSTIQIFGEHFGFGSTRRCRFGDHTGAIETDVVATVFSTSLSGDEVRCTSPPNPLTSVEMGLQQNVPAGHYLKVSVNGMQFSSPPLRYVYHEDPVISHINPVIGPEGGGSMIRLYGQLPRPTIEPTHPICRFVAGVVEVPVFASYDAPTGGDVLKCVAPPALQLQLDLSTLPGSIDLAQRSRLLPANHLPLHANLYGAIIVTERRANLRIHHHRHYGHEHRQYQHQLVQRAHLPYGHTEYTCKPHRRDNLTMPLAFTAFCSGYTRASHI